MVANAVDPAVVEEVKVVMQPLFLLVILDLRPKLTRLKAFSLAVVPLRMLESPSMKREEPRDSLM